MSQLGMSVSQMSINRLRCRNFNLIFFLIHDVLITGFVTRVTQREPLVRPEPLTLPEHRFIERPCYAILGVLFCCLVDRWWSFCPYLFTTALSVTRITPLIAPHLLSYSNHWYLLHSLHVCIA